MDFVYVSEKNRITLVHRCMKKGKAEIYGGIFFGGGITKFLYVGKPLITKSYKLGVIYIINLHDLINPLTIQGCSGTPTLPSVKSRILSFQLLIKFRLPANMPRPDQFADLFPSHCLPMSYQP